MKATPPAVPASRSTPKAPAGEISRAAATLAALGAGLLLGILLHGSTSDGIGKLVAAAAPVGQIWVSALQVTVLPLVIAQTFVAIVGAGGDRSVGALGVKALLLFLGMLIATGLFTLAVAPPLVSLYPVGADTMAALRQGTAILAAAPAARAEPTSIGDWLEGLILRNVFEAMRSGAVLPLLLLTTFFALAVCRLPRERREPLFRLLQAVAEATMVLVGWILRAAPLGVFALSFTMAFRAGLPVTGFIASFVVLACGLMTTVTALLYPLTAVLARTTMRRFAQAVAPAQMVAVSTRSSLASLPALVEGARDRLGLPELATGFVLPLSVSVFKLHTPVSTTVTLFFVSRVYGVPLSSLQIATFLLTVLTMSFSTVGVPGGGSPFRMLPVYLAAGLPIEGVALLEATDVIPDMFMTLTNVTGDMSAAAILSRRPREMPQA